MSDSVIPYRMLEHIAALDVEARNGPRYVEAIRGAREMRHQDIAFADWFCLVFRIPSPASERQRGIPEGWITR